MDSPDHWTEELSGILNWSIAGLRRLRQQRRFTTSKLVEDAREEYRAEMNPVRSFLEDHFHYNPAAQSLTTAKVYERYAGHEYESGRREAGWCAENGYKPLGERMFGREIKRAFPKVERKKFGTREKREYYYVGLAEGPEPPKEPDGVWE
jgi:putative DNA primase/helicase